MFSHVTGLTCPKSEHTVESNEDAFVVKPDIGVFALADGVGSLLHSRLWAQTIVQCFAEIPLLTSDAFELEWWMGEARRRFEQQVPPIADIAWHARRKAMEGSAATLAAVVVVSESSNELKLRVSEIGDACVFVAFGDGERLAMREGWREVVEVGRAPVSLGSVERKFDRGYQGGAWARGGWEVEVRGERGDVVVLASDEVARWILSQGSQRKQWEAVQALAGMSEQTWASFIVGARSRGEMEDDDATVVIVRPTRERGGVWVAATPPHGAQVVQERLHQFEEARREGDKGRMAVVYGDGKDCKGARVTREVIADARAVADAVNAVRQTYWGMLGRADVAMRNQQAWREATERRIRQAWLTHEAVLRRVENRVSVEKLLVMLHENALLTEMTLPEAPSEPPTTPDENSSLWFLLWLNSMIRALFALANIRDPRSGGGNTSW